MKAFAVSDYKGPLSEAEIAEPAVGDRDVLVQVAAAGVNHLDEKVRSGEFKQILPYQLPITLGHDLAGTVIETGTKVHGFKVGDQVYGRPRDGRIGTFAERISVDASDLAPRPATLSAVEAASLPLVALTAWQTLVDRGGVRAGQKVLIHAGAGAVGTIAIQLAKHLGATVATTTSAANADFARTLGADIVIDYRSHDFEQELSDYDLVLDSLGGDNLRKSLGVLRPGGKAIGISGPPDPAFAKEAGLNPVIRVAIAALSATTRRRAKKLGVDYEFHLMHASGDQLRQITTLVDSGVIHPTVGKTFTFDQTPMALEALATGAVRGKPVIILPAHVVRSTRPRRRSPTIMNKTRLPPRRPKERMPSQADR
ncbi:MAG TPA: NADP-dependent oxidoreductase [Microlunatus sp.]